MPANLRPVPSESRDVSSETSSTLKAFGVLEVLVRAGRPVTLAELIQATDLPKPSLHRTLALFEEAGLLTREPGGRASGSAPVCRASDSTCCATTARRPSGARSCAAWSRTSARSCNLAVLYKGDLIYLDRVEAEWPLRLQLPVGGVALRPHCCASGKLLLAHRPPAERSRLLGQMPLERFTERTITDRQVLASELDRIVGAGYAVDNEEYVLGVACVAVAVRDRRDEVVASLAVQGATARLPLMRALRVRAAPADCRARRRYDAGLIRSAASSPSGPRPESDAP